MDASAKLILFIYIIAPTASSPRVTLPTSHNSEYSNAEMAAIPINI
jgi:hypothetical protein